MPLMLPNAAYSTLDRPRFACSKANAKVRRQGLLCKDSPNGKGAISESVLARLKAAEEEAARLRIELAAAQATQGTTDIATDAKRKRIDGTNSRETLVLTSEAARGSWLSEADVEFFTGDGASKTAGKDPADVEADNGTVQRRLLIAGGISAIALALALIPTEKLRPRPPQPLSFYVISLLRIQELLVQSKEILEDARWDELRFALSRIKETPNRARESLDNCIAWIDDPSTASTATTTAAEFMGYLENMDYNKYFDAMPRKVLTGSQNAEFVGFSLKALASAQSKLSQFLRLLPADAVRDARAELDRMMQE